MRIGFFVGAATGRQNQNRIEMAGGPFSDALNVEVSIWVN